jgi:hypothetical protein
MMEELLRVDLFSAAGGELHFKSPAELDPIAVYRRAAVGEHRILSVEPGVGPIQDGDLSGQPRHRGSIRAAFDDLGRAQLHQLIDGSEENQAEIGDMRLRDCAGRQVGAPARPGERNELVEEQRQ